MSLVNLAFGIITAYFSSNNTNFQIQRISLNSYDDENYYKDDEDEVFDEIDFAQSPNEK